MRVLLVSHNFLPAHSAGTEVYTGQLARALVARGHSVRVVTTEKDISRPDLSVVRRRWEGIEVTEFTNNLFHASFRETWDNPRIEALFADELERERPDVVHFQHLLYLSIGCVELAAQAGLGVLFTLHDFWLHCARLGQRMHADGGLCERLDFARCGTCLASFKFRQSGLERATGRALAALRSGTGLDLSAAAKRAAQGLGRRKAVPAAARVPAPERAREMAELARERDEAMRSRVVPHVDRFIAPSRFLLERFVEWGIEPARIEHVRTGLDLSRFPAGARSRRAGTGPQLRVGFLGTLAPHKGPHLLLEAWARLPSELRGRATLELHGPASPDEAYRARLGELAKVAGAALGGPLARAEVAARVADLDLLVVPSVWFENSPMVIHEALALRTPVLVAALGGMAELVEPGVSGAHFVAGDAVDLARALRELLEQPSRLQAFFETPLALRSVAQDAERMEQLYREALES